jgi:hypothetical protein
LINDMQLKDLNLYCETFSTNFDPISLTTTYKNFLNESTQWLIQIHPVEPDSFFTNSEILFRDLNLPHDYWTFIDQFVYPLLDHLINAVLRILHWYSTTPGLNASDPTVPEVLIKSWIHDPLSLVDANPLAWNFNIISLSVIGFIVVAHILSAIKKIYRTIDLVRSGRLPTHYLVPIIIELGLNVRKAMMNVNARVARKFVYQSFWSPFMRPFSGLEHEAVIRFEREELATRFGG